MAGVGGEQIIHFGLPRHLPSFHRPNQRARRPKGLRNSHAILPDGSRDPEADSDRAQPPSDDQELPSREARPHAARRRHHQLVVAAGQGPCLRQRRGRPPTHQSLVNEI